MKTWSLFRIFLIFVFGILVGLLINYLNIPNQLTVVMNHLSPKVYPSTPGIRSQRQQGKFEFTNPLLDCDVADSTLSVYLHPFDDEFDAYMASVEKRPGISSVAVLLRDLIGGWRTGYKENLQFSPASLLKVPIFVAILKRVQKDPSYLDAHITYSVSYNPNTEKNITDSAEPPLEVGKDYTIRDLLEHMIIYSSNNAAAALTQQLTSSELETISTDLGITFKNDGKGDLTVGVTDYASFFRILYNSSYLPANLSEYALSVMSKANFREGIVAGVPSTIPVSHKFGERVDPNTGKTQLHDCGIVYYAKRPYVLCVMTIGTSFDVLKPAVKDISSFVYTKMSEQYEK